MPSDSIVGTILRDFCSSPTYLAEEQLINDSNYFCEPYFRFRKKRLRTYENISKRRKRGKTQLEHLSVPSATKKIYNSNYLSGQLTIEEDTLPDYKKLLLPIAQENERLLDDFVYPTDNLSSICDFFWFDFEDNSLNLLKRKETDIQLHDTFYTNNTLNNPLADLLEQDCELFINIDTQELRENKEVNATNYDEKNSLDKQELVTLQECRDKKGFCIGKKDMPDVRNQWMELLEEDCELFINIDMEELLQNEKVNATDCDEKNSLDNQELITLEECRDKKGFCIGKKDMPDVRNQWIELLEEDCELFINIDMQELLQNEKVNATNCDEKNSLDKQELITLEECSDKKGFCIGEKNMPNVRNQWFELLEEDCELFENINTHDLIMENRTPDNKLQHSLRTSDEGNDSYTATCDKNHTSKTFLELLEEDCDLFLNINTNDLFPESQLGENANIELIGKFDKKSQNSVEMRDVSSSKGDKKNISNPLLKLLEEDCDFFASFNIQEILNTVAKSNVAPSADNKTISETKDAEI